QCAAITPFATVLAPEPGSRHTAGVRERIRALLERVTASVELEARWLQTLSLLEYIGARKIGRTAAAHHPPGEVLSHWADETRHAAVFQALALERGRGAPLSYLCGEGAKAYFAELDSALTQWTTRWAGAEDPVSNYLLVTTAIERRAMALYPIYRAA